MEQAQKTLKDELITRSKVGELWFKEKEGAVRCYACGHRCFIPKGADGICKVRSNVGGELRVPWGYAAGIQVDPIEKKPFFHVYPGVNAMSFGMLGCDFHCSYCQNWYTSQALRDPKAEALPNEVSGEDLVALAVRAKSPVLCSTYNEPLITSEWAKHIFELGKARGLQGAYISNGNGTREVLEYIRPYTDFYKIDLKSFRDKSYRELGGVLKNILETIQNVYSMGFWLEIVTLVIPGFNDSAEEIRELTKFIASVSPDIPWHATAYHPDYKMNHNRTTVNDLERVGEMGREAGLNFVYLGNVHGRVGTWENTYCPHCKALVVERSGYHILQNRMTSASCPDCGKKVPGVWVKP